MVYCMIHHSVVVVDNVSLSSVRTTLSESSMPYNPSVVCLRYLLEVCTAAQLEYSEIIRLAIILVAGQFVMAVVMPNCIKKYNPAYAVHVTTMHAGKMIQKTE